MTDEMMNLRAQIEKSPDADLLREMIGFAAQRLMELLHGYMATAAAPVVELRVSLQQRSATLLDLIDVFSKLQRDLLTGRLRLVWR